MVVSNTAAGHRTPVRRRRGALAVAGIAAAVSLSAVPTADAAGPPADTTPAATAVRALTGSGNATARQLPADFGAVTGYHPAVVDGLLLAPQGSCSSPVPLPAEFDIACKAHDLGYDLLRYAQHSRQPLGRWARRDLDRALADRMLSACRERPDLLPRTRCLTMAGIAAAAVDLNSRRQGYGVPVVERFSVAETATTWLPRVALLLLAAFAGFLIRRAGAAGRFGRPRLPQLIGSNPSSAHRGAATSGPATGSRSGKSWGTRGLRTMPAAPGSALAALPFRREFA